MSAFDWNNGKESIFTGRKFSGADEARARANSGISPSSPLEAKRFTVFSVAGTRNVERRKQVRTKK